MTDLWFVKKAIETMISKHDDELSEAQKNACKKFTKMIQELYEYAYHEGYGDGVEEIRKSIKTDFGEQ